MWLLFADSDYYNVFSTPTVNIPTCMPTLSAMIHRLFLITFSN